MELVLGRERELESVRDALRDHGLCFLTGPGGVGKSAVATVLVEELDERAVVIDARAVGRPELVIARIAQAIDADHVVDPRDAISMCEALAERASASDLELVVIENAEYQSDATFDLLARFAVSANDVGILVTTRTHPTRTVGHVIRLLPLAVEGARPGRGSAAATLFRRSFVRAGGDPDELDRNMPALGRLLADTGGLPLAIIVTASRAALLGVDVVLDVYRSADPDTLVAENADPVTDVLERSLRDLDTTTLTVFTAIGIFHGPVRIDDLAAVADVAPDVAALCVEQLARRSLVDVEQRLVAMLPPVRRLAITHLGRRGARRTVEARHAEWAYDRCRAEPPLSTSEAATIEDDLTAALNASLRERRLDVAVTISLVLNETFRSDLRHGRRLEVLEPVVEALRTASVQDDDGRLVDTMIDTMRRTAIALADAVGWAAAGPLIDEAQTLIPRSATASSHTARLEALRADSLFESGDLRGARKAAVRSIDAANTCDDDVALTYSTRLLADVELESGHVAEAIRLANQVVHEAPPLPRGLRAYGLAMLAMCEIERGATATVLAATRQLTQEALKTGDMDLVVEADWLNAVVDPQHEPAAYDLSGERTGRSIMHVQADIASAIRRLASGDPQGAITLAADCELRASALPMCPLVIDSQLLVGGAAVELGELEEATRAYTEALTTATTQGYRLRVPDALDGLAAIADCRPSSRSLADDYLLAAAEIRDTLGVVPRAIVRRPAVPPVPGPSPVGWIDRGSLTDTGLREALDIAGSSRRQTAPDGPAGVLSPAERTVADLVAEGLTNREIGDRLHVSRRTVESHIAHAFQKLNVRSRTQLAAIILTARGSG